ncbi:MAG: RNA polymerase sigma factor [Candidatus Zambryskibacteria bacterium]
MENKTPKTDQELVADTLKEKHAFSEIVHKYEAPLRRYIKRLGCKNADDMNDVLQEIFIKVFVNLNDYDPDLKFSSWLYRIAHNETISFFRKKKVRPNVLDVEDVEEFFDNLADDTNSVELAQERYDAGIVQKSLSTLNPKYREVLILRFLEEKSYTEISDILKIPEGTVATLINRGKKELKTILENKDTKYI